MTPDLSVQPISTLADQVRHALVALAESAAAAGLPHPSDQALLDLQAPGDGAVVIAGAPLAPDGFAIVTRHGTSWTLETAVGPGIDGPTELALAAAALPAVAGRGGGPVRLWRHGDRSGDRDSAGNSDTDSDGPAALPVGFSLERELLQLRVPLQLPQAAPSVTIRAFRVGQDEAAWVAANNRAFAGHPEQSGWTVEDVTQREAEPWFDPAGFLLHEATGRLAAFCWTKVHAQMGEIYVIAADPDFQGRGLGKAMTMAGLAHLAAEGLPTGMLYVDAANTPAVTLYRSLGFELHHTDRAYLAEVAPD